MKTCYHTGRISLFTFVLLGTLVATACQHSETPQSDEQDRQRIFDSFLLESDLPVGWFRDYLGTDEDEIESETVHVAVFRATDEPGLEYIFVSQELVLYASETKARAGYQKWLRPSLELERHIPTEISFHSRADEFRVGCSYGITDTQPENVCVAIARYDRLVSQLIAKVWDKDDEEQWFTWVDFEQVLEAMDRRALEAAGR